MEVMRATSRPISSTSSSSSCFRISALAWSPRTTIKIAVFRIPDSGGAMLSIFWIISASSLVRVRDPVTHHGRGAAGVFLGLFDDVFGQDLGLLGIYWPQVQ